MRFPAKTILAGLTLASLSPLLAMLAASAIAGILDCPLDEGSRHVCRIAGVDIGDELYVGFVSAWFMFLTWPALPACLLAWAFIAALGCVRWLRRRVRHA